MILILSTRIDFTLQDIDCSLHVRILRHLVLNSCDTVHDGRMVPCQHLSDGFIRKIQHLPAEIHHNLTRLCDLGIALF